MSTSPGPIRGRLEALQQRLTQTVETTTRTSQLHVTNPSVDDLHPPADIDEFHELYRDLGVIRGNINQFVRDVVEPGIRVNADDPTTEAYFTGSPPEDGGSVPEFAPQGGFIKNCAVIAGERNQPFYPYLKTSIVQKYTRGTALHEYLKRDADKDDPKPPIQGFTLVRPETVSARVHANKNILLAPDETGVADELTRRGEAAAYVQFSDRSILGERINGFEEESVALSSNDVLKQVNDPEIGGDEATEDGVFGASPIEAIAADATDYRDIKRNRAQAIKTKVEGVWVAEFDTEVVEAGTETIVTTWDESEQTEWINEVGELEPGAFIGHDGSITLDQWEPSLPALDDDLQHLVDDILAPLPAPKYATAHGDDITQHVTGEQRDAYQDLIGEERQAQERDWTQAFREVASRHPRLDPSGVAVRLAPTASSNPVAELSDEEIERMEQFMSALDSGLGDVPVDMVLDVEEFLKTTMDLPEEVFAGDEIDADESAEELQHMIESYNPDHDGDGVTADGS
jgi:hypothetical protein